MGKQSKARKQDIFGKGKVTPIQIAFIVDRYLCDNNFAETRNMFRNEASSLIANSPLQEVPKTLLSLGDMLNEYICLKEQKVMVDQERFHVEQEKYRVQMLLQGMQNVMSAYNASGNLPASNFPAPAAKSTVAIVPQPQISNKSAPGVPTPMPNAIIMQSLPASANSNAETGKSSTPQINLSDKKRKDSKVMDAPSVAKKSRGRTAASKISSQVPDRLPQPDNAVNNQVVALPSSAIKPSSGNCIPSGSQVQISSVAKCLFNQPSLSAQTNSPVPKTPPRANSSLTDTYISPPQTSPIANCSKNNASRHVTPNRCTVISTKRVMVSPAKQMAYIERSHCISPVKKDLDKVSKRDHVRSRLDFDATDMTENLDKAVSNEMSKSEKEVDPFDIDFPNLETLGIDFSFTEMLGDLDFHYEDIDFSCHPTSSTSKDNASGSPQDCEVDQVISELSSTMTEVLSEKDMNIQGPDCLTAMKSVTKCITILSPVKNRQPSGSGE